MYQLFDTLTFMSLFSASTVSVAITAAIIYLWLRSVGRGRKLPAVQRARSHSFWCALMAFFASTSWDLEKLWATSEQSDSPLTLITLALSAGGWVALVYIIGLFSWPQELQPVRVASLEPRTFTTAFPRKLGAFIGVLALVSIGLLWPASQVAGQSPQNETAMTSTSDYGEPLEQGWSGDPGWRSGSDVVPLLALCILGVLVATTLVSFIILNRHPLAGISTTHNQQLRTVWLNRLLRNTGWVLISISASAITYASPVLGSGWNSVSTFVYLGLGFVLLVWGPTVPGFERGRAETDSAFSRMRAHTLNVSYLATTVLLACAYVIATVSGQRFTEAAESYGEMRAKLSSASVILFWGAAAIALFLVISAGFALYVDRRAKHGPSLSPKSQNLPIWVYTIAALCVATGIVLLYASEAVSPDPTMTISPWNTTGVAAGLLVVAAGYCWWVRRCSVPWDVTSEQEIWYRQVLEFRALRVLSSAFLLLPGLAYSGQPAVIALGVGLFCIPAFLVIDRPKTTALASARA